MKKEYKNPLTEIVLSSPMVLHSASIHMNETEDNLMGNAPKRSINIMYI